MVKCSKFSARNRFNFLMSCSMAVLAIGSSGGPVHAAAASADNSPIETVVVTAQFRRQDVQKTPLSITAVSGDTLAARSQTNLSEVAAQAPNVNLKPAQGSFGPTLQAFIRGVGQYDFNFALEPGVGVYVDDVYYSTSAGSLLDLLDLDRVEILRGPQGTLAGQNSIGGAIKLYSKIPDGNDGGFIQGTYGSFNRAEARGGLDVTLIPDQLFARTSFVAVHKDGYVDRYDFGCAHPSSGVAAFASGNCKIGDEGGKNYAGIRQSVRWVPTDKLEVTVIGDYTYDRSEAAANTLLYVGTTTATGSSGPRTTINGVPLGTATGSVFIPYSPLGSYAKDTFTTDPYVDYSSYCDRSPTDGSPAFCVPHSSWLSTWGFSANVKYDLTDTLSLVSITSYRSYTSQWSIDEGTPVNDALLANNISHHQLSEEVRLNGTLFDGAVDFTIGGFYFDQKSHYGGLVGVRSINYFTENDFIPASTSAVFTNVDWHVTDKLDLIGGLRYTNQDKTFNYGRLPHPGSTSGTTPVQVAGLNGAVGKFSGNHVDYRAAIQYQWTPDVMTYAQFSTGFKGGGVNPRPFNPSQALPFGAETLSAYEIGAKTEFFNNRVRLNLSAFFNEYNNIVVNTTSCPPALGVPCFLPLNAGKAHDKGVELEATILPFDGMAIDASMGYLGFRYTSISAIAASSGITLGMKTPFTPSMQYSIGAQYDINLGDLGTLTPRVDLNYQGSFFTGATNAAPYNLVPSHTVMNARLTWVTPDPLWQVSFEVKNLADKLYYYSYRDDRSSSETVQGAIAPPREFAITVKRSF
jgi:iron complex outermembrane receptor protein